MGILDNVEKGLERAVSGTFAKTFRSKLQPVELAAGLRRELDIHAAVVSRERTVAPNSFRIRVCAVDRERLAGLGATLTDELVAVVRKHAARQGYQLPGPPQVTLVEDPALGEGMFEIGATSLTSTVIWAPALDVAGQRHLLTERRTVIGRSSSADIVVDDAGVSRQHLEIVWEDDTVSARDLGSTNGSRLDGESLTRALLRPDSVLQIGSTRIVYRLVPRQVARPVDAGRAGDGAHEPGGPGDSGQESGGAGQQEPWERR